MDNKSKQLYHVWMEDNETFLKRIDEFGGWPHNARCVVMKHTGIDGERPCYFSAAESVRDEWNTSILTADDYYMWKLSSTAKQEWERKMRVKIGQEILRG